MFNLLVVVVSIILASLVATGGMLYISPDVGVRSIVYAKTTTAMTIVGQAMLSYRQANGVEPSLDTASTSTWTSEIAPYLPGGHMPEISDLSWSYLVADGRARVCLSTIPGSKVDTAVLAAVRRSVGENRTLFLSATCEGTVDDAASPESFAVVMVR